MNEDILIGLGEVSELTMGPPGCKTELINQQRYEEVCDE